MDLVKTCSKCKEVKPVTEFRRDARMRSGLTCWCKSCANASREAWQKANPGKMRAWATKNRERTRAHCAAWAKKNPEKVRANRAVWAKKNPEKRRGTNKARRETLSDGYIRDLLAKSSPINSKHIPRTLIDLKRVQVLIARKLKELKDANDSDPSAE